MPVNDETPDAKQNALRQARALYRRAHAVTDPLFKNSPDFFDARDLVQVKYEMVRRVQHDGLSVSEAAAAFGFSRPAFYQAQTALTAHGLPGLLPDRPGPRRAHKLSDAVMAMVEQARAGDPALTATRLAALVRERFGIVVHPRSIERALARRQKKRPDTD